MRRSIRRLACVLAVAAIEAGCAGVHGIAREGNGNIENGRFSATDGGWSIAVPATLGSRPWIDEIRRDGESGVALGTRFSRTQWLVMVSDAPSEGLPIPSEASRAVLDQMQESLAELRASVHVLDEAETREVGRSAVFRAWVEEIPERGGVFNRTEAHSARRLVQVETRGDRGVVFILVIDDGERWPRVERDRALLFSRHWKAWQDFIGSFRFEATAAERAPPR